MNPNSKTPELVITPPTGWLSIDFKELVAYRDLFYFLVWRDIKVMYAQSILGVAWGIIQPVMNILIFSIIFGHVAKIPTDGIPYILFSTVAIIPWTYMSSAMTQSSQSLLSNQGMLGKIYFPRMIFPLAPILSLFGNFCVSCLVLISVLVYYRIPPTWNIAYLPIFLLMMMCIPAGVGMWLSSMAVRYRDVKFAMHYFIQLLMYSAPIVYSASTIPENLRIVYSLNPIVGVIEGFRGVFLGMEMAWTYIIPGMITAAVLFISGAFYFRKMERIIADV
jgi:lipopolysaccharide transport system permease protein